MSRKKSLWLVAAGTLAAAASLAAALLPARDAGAADHLDPPARTNPTAGGTDRAADIADVYAWHRGSGATQTLVLAMTFGGPLAPTDALPYDRDVLYQLHIDRTGDSLADAVINCRFGQNASSAWGVRCDGVPGTTAPMVSAVDTTLTAGEVKLFAGKREDPFFFDLEGFRTTLSTGALSFNAARDFFAGKNELAIVLELPMSAALGAGTGLQVWGTTSRITSGGAT